MYHRLCDFTLGSDARVGVLPGKGTDTAAPARVALLHGERLMPDETKSTNTQDLANSEYDGERWARVGAERQSVSPASPKTTTDPTDRPEVGLTQKGTDEDAAVKRETDV